MASDTQIANKALTHLGTRTITSFSDTSEMARKVNLIYADTRDEVLRACSWNFASKTITLALLADTHPEWMYLYAYPANTLFIRRVFDATLPTPQSDPTFDPQAQYDETLDNYNGPSKFLVLRAPVLDVTAIACNLASAYAECTMQITDPTQFDADFVSCFSLLLASRLATPLTADKALMSAKYQEYRDALARAQQTNGSEGIFKRSTKSSFLGSR